MIAEVNKTIHIRYYATLREQRGLSEETVKTNATTPFELYQELRKQHRFSLSSDILRIAINNSFDSWDTLLKDKDEIVFIPPVAGG